MGLTERLIYRGYNDVAMPMKGTPDICALSLTPTSFFPENLRYFYSTVIFPFTILCVYA